jgi:Type I phosphodiesterase / nucleotide pyrophosphatase
VRSHRCSAIAILGAALVAALPLFRNVAADDAAPAGPKRPKLGVVLVFDQMRGDYPEKWKSLFVDGGFKRLQTEGATFVDCHYPYANTVTAAGHASLLTGCPPHEHGIVANAWFDRRTGKTVQSITGLFGPDPLRRKQPTVGDVLLEKTGGKAKVVSLSIKDRAAILMAALRAQIVYWLSSEDQFVTSRYYADERRPWVSEFNKAGKLQAYCGKPWRHLLEELDYEPFSGPDNFKYEGTGSGQGRVFPHPTPTTAAVRCSPFGNEVLLDFAKTAIEKEALGAGDVPDLLCLSFSSNDLVGHAYGPDSQEVLDITLRSDRIVRDLLDFLDARVGKGEYFVVLSADHGICPLPEAAKLHGQDGGHVPTALLAKKAQEFLQETFGAGKPKIKWIEASQAPWIYLDQSILADEGLASADVERALADWLVKQPGIDRAFTRAELSSAQPLADPITESARLSFDPERSGDVTVVLKPYHLFGGNTATGTTHGSPHPYDTHVPLLVMGPGIEPGTRREHVSSLALAPILAHGLGIDAPESAKCPVPDGLFRSIR